MSCRMQSTHFEFDDRNLIYIYRMIVYLYFRLLICLCDYFININNYMHKYYVRKKLNLI